jgi:anti-sigma-K factor RskA
MIDELQDELAALAALDLLEGADAAEFAAACAVNPELRRRVDELRTAAAELAHAAAPAEPPGELKERILASAAVHRPARTSERQPARVLLFPFVPWAVAACFALIAGLMGQLYFAARARSQVLEDERRLADVALQTLRNSIEAERIVSSKEIQQLKAAADMANMKVAMLTSQMQQAPQAEAVAVWNPMTQQGMIRAAHLPMPQPDRDYEAWYVFADAKAPPISAGLVHVDPGSGEATVDLRAHKPMPEVAKFAVSVEPKGGATTPSAHIILVSNQL